MQYAMLRNAEDYVRCRASAIPYDYWRMGKEKESRMEDNRHINNNFEYRPQSPHYKAAVIVTGGSAYYRRPTFYFRATPPDMIK